MYSPEDVEALIAEKDGLSNYACIYIYICLHVYIYIYLYTYRYIIYPELYTRRKTQRSTFVITLTFLVTRRS